MSDQSLCAGVLEGASGWLVRVGLPVDIESLTERIKFGHGMTRSPLSAERVEGYRSLCEIAEGPMEKAVCWP